MLNKLISAPTWGAFLFSEAERRIINHGKNQLLPNLVRRNPLYESTHQVDAFEHRCKARAKPLSGSPAGRNILAGWPNYQRTRLSLVRKALKFQAYRPAPWKNAASSNAGRTKTTSAASVSTSRKKAAAESAAIDAEFSALFEENPDAAELQQQVIEGFIAFRKLASLNSQLKPSLPIPTQERKTRWVSPVIK